MTTSSQIPVPFEIWTDARGQKAYLHGTKAALRLGDLIAPGHPMNFGDHAPASFVYMSQTLDAATWGAELSVGEGRGHIYIVEPTGPIEDDPDLTNKKFPGNPTRSFRSREPLRVIGELADWEGHSPEQLQAMRDGIARIQAERAPA